MYRTGTFCSDRNAGDSGAALWNPPVSIKAAPNEKAWLVVVDGDLSLLHETGTRIVAFQ
jgi:hypothetical protein